MDFPTGQSRLVQFGFRRLTKEEIQQKTTDRAALYNPVAVKEKQDALREASKVKAEEAAAAKADAARYLNMKRQKRFRDRERKKKAMARTEEIEEEERSAPVASLPIAVHSSKQNWYDPLYWNDIVVALQDAEFNSRKAVRLLQSKFSHDGRFNRLTHSTIEGWYCRTTDASGNRGIIWQEAVLIRVQNRQSMFLPGTGRNGILNSHPEIVALISDMLQNMRKTGCVVNGTVARVIIVGILQSLLPSILVENGGRFKVSASWVSAFCAEALGWSFRKGTTAAQKLPHNFNEQGYMTILRLAYYVRVFNVPRSNVFNADQTGVTLVPSGNDRTYDVKGGKDVSVIGSEEKRAFTACLGSAADGTILPFQSIWKGKTTSSLPKTRDQFRHMRFRYGLNEKNHWSNLKTTQDYFEHILSSRIDEDQYWVAYIDCWKIHKSKAFLDWARAKYPKLLILFVPAGCTGKFQPADLILQRVFKHIIRREFNALMANMVKEHLCSGKDSSSFKMNTHLGYLRDLTPGFLAKAYKYMLDNPDLVSRSWSKAVADVPNKAGQQINLLDAWKDDVQQAALEQFAAGTLFPNQQENQADEIEDLMGETAINDGDEVPVENLANILVEDGIHPAVCDNDIDHDMHGDEE